MEKKEYTILWLSENIITDFFPEIDLYQTQCRLPVFVHGDNYQKFKEKNEYLFAGLDFVAGILLNLSHPEKIVDPILRCDVEREGLNAISKISGALKHPVYSIMIEACKIPERYISTPGHLRMIKYVNQLII